MAMKMGSLRRERAGQVAPRTPPSYDPARTDYTGISAGALQSMGDVHLARELAEVIVDTVQESLLVLDPEFRVGMANETFYQTFRHTPENTIGRSLFDLGRIPWQAILFRALLEEVLPNDKPVVDFEAECDIETIGPRHVILNARRLNAHELILLSIQDITNQRRAEGKLRESNTKLEERTQQVLKLSRAVTLAEQRERQRIADVLHDDLQQILFGVKLARSNGDLGRLDAVVDRALEIVRRLSCELSPPLLRGDDLTDLLLWIAERQRVQYGLDVEVDVGQSVSIPRASIRLLVYQVVREVLFHIAMNATVKRARLVAAQANNRLQIMIEGAGAGFNIAALEAGTPVGLELTRVREQLELVGGRLRVESPVGADPRVAIMVPVRMD